MKLETYQGGIHSAQGATTNHCIEPCSQLQTTAIKVAALLHWSLRRAAPIMQCIYVALGNEIQISYTSVKFLMVHFISTYNGKLFVINFRILYPLINYSLDIYHSFHSLGSYTCLITDFNRYTVMLLIDILSFNQSRFNQSRLK